MDIVNLFLQLAGGMAGGCVISRAIGHASLSKSGLIVTGIVGGGLGIQAVNLSVGLAVAASAARDLDAGTLVTQLAGACLGGAILTLLVAFVTRRRGTKQPLRT